MKIKEVVGWVCWGVVGLEHGVQCPDPGVGQVVVVPSRRRRAVDGRWIILKTLQHNTTCTLKAHT